MVELGRISKLPITRFTDNGAYLRLESGEEVLLPKAYLKGEEEIDGQVEVFVYTDSEDRPVAATTFPKALLDEFAVMEVVSTAPFGAFVDWGLLKDLLIPKTEMAQTLNVGDKYLVRVCLDHKTQRLIGVTKYRDFLETDTRGFVEGQEVELLLFEATELGYKALIEGAFEGLLYKNEIFSQVAVGDKLKGYVKKVREDGKLDLSLSPIGRQKYEEGAQTILDMLKVRKFLPLHDKSSPESIKQALGMSKKHFKQSIGQLYKAQKIEIQPNGIYLLEED